MKMSSWQTKIIIYMSKILIIISLKIKARLVFKIVLNKLNNQDLNKSKEILFNRTNLKRIIAKLLLI